MKETNVAKREFGSNYRTIGQIFLVLAFVFLLAAALLEGSGQIGTRIMLVIIGGSLTISGAILIWLPRTNTSAEKAA